MGKDKTSVQQVFTYLETPVIYSMTAITVSVSMLVYGTTLIQSGSDGGLLDWLKPIFGVPYSVAMIGLLASILAMNRRGKVLIVLGLGEFLHLIILFSPGGQRAFDWGEHLSSAALIAYLLAFSCIHFDLVEHPSNPSWPEQM